MLSLYVLILIDPALPAHISEFYGRFPALAEFHFFSIHGAGGRAGDQRQIGLPSASAAWRHGFATRFLSWFGFMNGFQRMEEVGVDSILVVSLG
jgi:hypothetical protein